ncbi:MAG TPA: PQ-loop repeat-containing protein [Polyangia bacterium]|nr:PQ-loop repeat-containing protein [Polyangia bacterium]
MKPEVIGWTSSVILFLTLSQQVWKQWKDGSTKGVSRWLFVGQLAASLGFTIYSLLKRDWVFVTTNGAMVMNALVGCLVLRHNRRPPRNSD